MKFSYSRNYYPPAPMVDVIFASAAEQLQTEAMPAFIDSGADGTIVPIEHLNKLRILLDGRNEIVEISE